MFRRDVNETILSVCLGLVVVGTSCTTIITQSDYWSGDETADGEHAPLIYGGTRGDIEMLGQASLVNAGPCGPFAPLFILDLPFSLAADTLLLPLTIWQTIARDHHAEPNPGANQGDKVAPEASTTQKPD